MDADWVEIPSHTAARAKPQPTTVTDVTPLYDGMKANASRLLAEHPHSPIFHTSIAELSEIYESSYPAELQQEFKCNACQKFLRRFGDLALVADAGDLLPLFWRTAGTDASGEFREGWGGPSVVAGIGEESADADARGRAGGRWKLGTVGDGYTEFYRGPVTAVARSFEGRRITREFKVTKKNARVGIKESPGGWTHMHFDFPSDRMRTEALHGLTATPSTTEQASMLNNILAEYDIHTVLRAAQLLLEDKLSNSDSHKASIRWLLDLIESRTLDIPNETARHNLVYHAAASSFTGCLKQLRSGAVSKLLSDIKDNKSFGEIERAWNSIAGPISYMRPTASPTAGNIAVAEKLFGSLGLTRQDMRREYLTPDGIPEAAYIYRDGTLSAKPPKTGVFSNLLPKGRMSGPLPPRDVPATSLSFSTFIRKIVPTAKKIEYQLGQSDSIYFFITGLPDTKPLMQWHDDSNRISWYTWTTTEPVHKFGLNAGWVNVQYIVPFPHLWDGIPETSTLPLSETADFKYYHKNHGFRYLIGLEGVVEKSTMELCLFPTLLKGEFHGVRKTIERYSQMGKIELSKRLREMVGGVEIARSKAGKEKHVIRVVDGKGQVGLYEISLFE